MSERTDADKLAEKIVNGVEMRTPGDDDILLLARQLLRRREVIERIEKTLAEQQDGTRDLIEANRDSILRIHEEGMRRIQRAAGHGNSTLILSIIEAVIRFHPMHYWAGWPEGS
jgi:hypothetical protein